MSVVSMPCDLQLSLPSIVNKDKENSPKNIQRPSLCWWVESIGWSVGLRPGAACLHLPLFPPGKICPSVIAPSFPSTYSSLGVKSYHHLSDVPSHNPLKTIHPQPQSHEFLFIEKCHADCTYCWSSATEENVFLIKHVSKTPGFLNICVLLNVETLCL